MTSKQLAAAQRRRLKTIQKTLLDMAAQWGDVDEFNVNELARLAAQAEAVSAALYAPDDKGE